MKPQSSRSFWTSIVLLTALALTGCSLLGCDESSPTQIDATGVDAVTTDTTDTSSIADAATDASTDANPADVDEPEADTEEPEDVEVDDGQNPIIPQPLAACPDLNEGYVTFSIEDAEDRDVLIYRDPNATPSGMIVLYWHGTGSQPEEAEYSIGRADFSGILADGGIVLAPTADPKAGTFPWYKTTGPIAKDFDMRLADEMVGCAVRAGYDERRVHTLGMSAGGIQAAYLSVQRAAYIASVVTFSGGYVTYAPLPKRDRLANKFAALMFHGGAEDVVVISFEEATEKYSKDLAKNGQFRVVCDHGRGHVVPTDAAKTVIEFFKRHEFGKSSSPWVLGLPSDAPSYCEVQ